MSGSMQYKTCSSEVKAFDDDSLVVEHFISTEERDRGGDLLSADGCIIDGTPVVLVQHGMDVKFGAEPVAKPLSIVVGTHNGKKGLIAKTQYFPDDTGRRLYQKAKEGYMSSWSIGWEPVEQKPVAGGRDVSKWYLYEYSQVSVPMNPGATTIKDASGKIEYKVVLKKSAEENPSASADEVPADPGAASTPDCTDPPQEPEPGSGILLKSIASRVNGRIPYDNIQTCFYAFTDELFNIEPNEKAVKALVKELSEMITPYAVQFTAHLASMRAENKDFNAIEYKSMFTKSEDSAAADPAPAEPQGTEPDQPPEVVEEEPEQEDAVEFGDDVLQAISEDAEEAEPAEEEDGLQISAEELTEAVSEAVQNELKTMLYGRID